MSRPVTRSSSDGNFTMWPNDFWDQLALTLDPVDVAVFGHLYRLASIESAELPLGYCKISLPRLCTRANCQLTRLRSSLARLEARELIERLWIDGESSNVNERGVVWRVNFDFVERREPVIKADRSRPVTGPAIAPMKENQKDSGKEALALMAVRIVEWAAERGEERPTALEIERQMRDAMAITASDYPDVEIIAAARKFGREGD